MNFKERLKRAGMTKNDFAERIGVSRSTVFSWGENPPKYADVVLELILENNAYRELRRHNG